MELDAEELKSTLRTQGYAVVPRVFPASALEALSAATSRMIDRWYGGERQDQDYWWFEMEGAEAPILYRIHNLQQKEEPAVRWLLESEVLRRVVGAVFGGEAVATRCALIVKIPKRGAEVPWHRDPIPVPPCTVYNFSVFLDDSEASGGCLEVLPGSHLFPPEYAVAKQRPKGAVPIAVKKGDVVVHDVQVIHGSAWNSSEHWRRSVVLEYQAMRSEVHK